MVELKIKEANQEDKTKEIQKQNTERKLELRKEARKEMRNQGSKEKR